MKRKPSIQRAFVVNQMAIVCLIAVAAGCFIFARELHYFNKVNEQIKNKSLVEQKQLFSSRINRLAEQIKLSLIENDNRTRTNLKNRVNEALGIVEYLYEQNKQKDKAQIIKLIKDALRNFRYNNGRGYFFIVSMDGTDILFPIKPELEGQNVLHLTDARGKNVIEEEINIARNIGEGIASGYWTLPNDKSKNVFEKISFIKYFSPLNFYIGSGEYILDTENDLQTQFLEQIQKTYYDNNTDNYMVINTFGGKCVLNNAIETEVGKNLWDTTDANGLKIVQEQYRRATMFPEGDFFEYEWIKPSTKIISKRIVYVKAIPEWKWIISTGIYLDNVEALSSAQKSTLRSFVVQRLLEFSLILILIFVGSYLVVRYLIQRTNKNFNVFFTFFEKAATESVEIDIKRINFAEFEQLALAANKMLEERGLSEQMLRETYEKLTSLLNNSPDIIFTVDIEGDILFINREREGYNHDETVGNNWLETIPKDNRSKFENVLSDVFKSEKNVTIEYQDIYGSWWETRFIPIKLSNVIEYVLGISTDISVSKWAMATLQESETRFKGLADATFEAVFIVENRSILEANQSACDMFGYEMQEMLGSSVFDLIDVDYQRHLLENIKTGNSAPIEIVGITKQKHRFYAEARVKVSYYKGKKVRITGIRDISARKLAEIELSKARALLEVAVAQSPMGVIITENPNYVIRMLNSAAVEILGIEKDKSPIGMSLLDYHQSWTDHSSPEAEQNYFDTPMYRTFNGEVIKNEEVIVKHGNGETRWILVSGSPIKNDKGEIIASIIVFPDASQRIKDQIELRKSQANLAKAQQVANIGSWTYKLQSKEFECSEVTYKIFDVEPKKFSSFDSLIVMVLPEDCEIVTEFFSAQTAILSHEIEFQMKRTDGEIRILNLKAEPVYNECQQVIELIGTFQDVTKSRHEEGALRESNEKLRLIFENNPLGVVHINTLGIVTTFNNNFAKIIGVNKNNLFGFNLITDLRSGGIVSAIKTALSKKMGHFEGEYLSISTRQKSFIKAEFAPIITTDNELRGCIGIVEDITERKKAEQEIKFERDLLSALMNSIPDTIYFKDIDSRFLRINLAQANILGISDQKEAIGKSDFDFFSHEFASATLKDEQEIVHTGNPLINKVEEIIRPNSGIWVSVTKVPIKDEFGVVVGLVGISRDVTEQKQHEQLLKDAIEKAKEADRLKSAFLANMSHEIRTPMNAIIGFSELLSNPDLLDEQRLTYIEYIINSGNSLLNLIDDIIDIAKIEAGHVKISKVSFSLSRFFDEVLIANNEIKKRREKSHIQLKVNIPTEYRNLVINTDSHRMMQIFNNLIGNSIKFTEHGMVEFGFEIPDNQHIRFYVKDTGKGIKHEYLEMIFERFRQVDDSFTKRQGGTGLGLAITKNLVELLGGNIWVESTVEIGSTFYFTIPYEQNEMDNMLSDTPVENYVIDWKSFTFLVAEDDDINFFFLREALQFTKVNIVRASNGLEAINISKSKDFDIILMDIKMPILDGFEATRQIKRNKPQIPIIAQTAYAMAGEDEKAYQAGCDGYVTKPLKIKELVVIVNKFLNPAT